MKTLNAFALLAVLVSLPLLLGGCGEKQSTAETKPLKEKQQEVKNEEPVPVTKPLEENQGEVKEEVKPEESVAETDAKDLESELVEVGPEPDFAIPPKDNDEDDTKFKTHEKNFKYQIKDGGVIISGYDKKLSDELIIPATIEGKPVISIGEDAFSFCTALTNITIPDGVTSIGGAAFMGCESLKSITIPQGVTTVLPITFNGCRSLTSITIPDSVTNIEGAAFQACERLMNLTIPDSVTNIGENAFFLCSSLNDLTIPASATNIGAKAFIFCNKLKSLTFLGDPPKVDKSIFGPTKPIIYRKAEVKGWETTWKGSPVKLISEKP
jgi:hypothetical protein